MRKMLGEVDQLLRGALTREDDLRDGRVGGRTWSLIAAGLLLGIAYGAFMGLYAVLRTKAPSLPQLGATMVKVPLLFLLTLAVTFPSLYVASALVQSSLRLLPTARLLLMAVVVNLALLASFGPVTGFFTLSTESYPFMILLNVVFFGASGLAGLAFLRRALGSVLDPPDSKARAAASRGKSVFLVWIIIYGAVGAQMGWILRPFIGSPDLPFTFFRSRESSFFEGVLRAFANLFS